MTALSKVTLYLGTLENQQYKGWLSCIKFLQLSEKFVNIGEERAKSQNNTKIHIIIIIAERGGSKVYIKLKKNTEF